MQRGEAYGDGPLPLEVISEVLLRLPVKSLCRFRCVSTLWRSIISDPHFVSSHFACSSFRPKLLLSVDERAGYEVAMRTKGKLLFSIDYAENPEDLRQAASYRCRIGSTRLTVPQSVRGLICVHAYEGAQICNPATGELMTFSTPSARAADCCKSDVFLGYDPVEKKYKILNSWATSFRGPMMEMRILTFGEKDWRRVDLGAVNLRFTDDRICVDGVMYFMGLTEHFEAYLVVFDVRFETFQVIPVPADKTYLHGNMCLMEFGGRAALLDYWVPIVEGLEGVLRLWIFEDHEQVWSLKEFSLSLHLKDTLRNEPSYLVGVTHKAELILAPTLSVEAFHWYFYNLEHATMRKLEVCGLSVHEHALTRRLHDCGMVRYHVESLQSLQGLCMEQ